MNKPRLSILKGTIYTLTAIAVLVFPAVTSFPQSAEAIAFMSPSPSATSQPTPTQTETESLTPTPSASFNKALYSITKPDSLWVVVDKRRPLKPKSFVPQNLVTPRFDDGAGQNPYLLRMAKPAAKAVKQMATAMKAAKTGTLVLSSTYRSYTTQVAVHARDVAQLGLKAGENLAARPGYSEHQTGLAADLSVAGQGCAIRVCFANTKGGKWLAANAWRYGFILRYPNGATQITGYQFEPWHFRYVGIELSTEMHNTKVTVLETFFGLPAAPTY